jgi:hypothetical protein
MAATEIFSLLSTVIDGFGCCTSSRETPLVFVLTFPDDRVEVLSESRADSSYVADVFKRGDTAVSISVCGAGSNGTCDQDVDVVDLGLVMVSVNPSSSGVFPYGSEARDRSFRGVLDGARPIYPPESIPFFSNYHNAIFVSRITSWVCVCGGGGGVDGRWTVETLELFLPPELLIKSHNSYSGDCHLHKLVAPSPTSPFKASIGYCMVGYPDHKMPSVTISVTNF